MKVEKPISPSGLTKVANILLVQRAKLDIPSKFSFWTADSPKQDEDFSSAHTIGKLRKNQPSQMDIDSKISKRIRFILLDCFSAYVCVADQGRPITATSTPSEKSKEVLVDGKKCSWSLDVIADRPLKGIALVKMLSIYHMLCNSLSNQQSCRGNACRESSNRRRPKTSGMRHHLRSLWWRR